MQVRIGALLRIARVAFSLMVVIACLFSPLTLHAGLDDPILIEPDVLVSAPVSPPQGEPAVLLVQGTSWAGEAHHYIITLANTSPWPLGGIYLLDRYFPDDPLSEEQATEWPLDRLEAGQAASFVVNVSKGPFERACHQIEMHWSEGWSAILMDCNAPPATTIWEIPLSAEMAVYPPQPSLTAAEPSGPSKLGLHVTGSTSPRIMEFIEATKPAVVVVVGDLGLLAEIKRVSPNTVTLGRLLQGDQSMTGDPRQRAREFVLANAGQYLANPGADYWLGWNEPDVSQPWQMAWYAAFEAERAAAMAELGLKVAIGNFSTGTPEAERFVEFLPAIKAAKEYGGILALHEYSAPTMQSGLGADIPGLEGKEHYGALTLRYRYWYDQYLQANNLVIPLVISEAGIDGGVLRAQGVTLGGWRDFRSAERLPEGMQPLTLDDYVAQLSWYDDELRRDPYVIGFAVFNVGDKQGEWASFDLTDELPRLVPIVTAKQ